MAVEISADRKAALLTNAQRRWLLGEEKRPSAERELRSRLSERVRHGLLDMAMLVRELDDGDRERIFEEEVDGNDPEELLPYLVAFMFQHHSTIEREGSPRDLEEAVDRGVELGGAAMGYSLAVRSDIDVAVRKRAGDVLERLEKDGVAAVTLDELNELHDSGQIDTDRYRELYIEKNESAREKAREAADENDRHVLAGSLEELGIILNEWEDRDESADTTDG